MNIGYRAVREMDIMLRRRIGNKSAINIPPIGVMERASTTPVLPATALVKRAKENKRTVPCLSLSWICEIEHNCFTKVKIPYISIVEWKISSGLVV
jgi:hypothetical protein